jgi:hypothetical protein
VVGMELSESRDPDDGDTLGDATDWVPADACTLPTVEQPLRVAQFDELFTTSLRHIVRHGSRRALLVLAGDQDLPARVQRLADAETTCCSFFAFTVTPLEAQAAPLPADTRVELAIEVPANRTEVLDGLLDRAEQARQQVS